MFANHVRVTMFPCHRSLGKLPRKNEPMPAILAESQIHHEEFFVNLAFSQNGDCHYSDLASLVRLR